MAHVHGMQEDNLTGKVYDKDLFKRLIRYLKPYKWYVIVSFFLLLLITAAELSIPLITRHVVDEYITSNKTLVLFREKSEFEKFAADYPKLSSEPYSFQDTN